MAVLRLLSEGRIDSDAAVSLLRALGEAGAGRSPDPSAGERAAVLDLLGNGRVDADGATALLRALAEAGMGWDEGAGAQERSSVLQMLRDGRVDLDEAVSLLRALRRDRGGQRRGPGFRFEFGRGEGPGFRGNPERWERAAQRAAERARRAADFWSQNAEEIAERAGRVAEQVGENMGRVFAGVPDVVERMARAGWGNWGPGYRFDDVVEGAIPAGDVVTLDLEGWNGPVTVRPVDGDRVRLALRKTVHAASEDAAREVALAVEASVDGAARLVRVGRRQGSPAWPGGLALEAYVPGSLGWTGAVRTGNGPVEVQGLTLRGMRLETNNGPVRAEGCQASDLSVSTSNGRIEVRSALSGRSDLRTSNGSIEVVPAGGPGGDSEIRAATSNGSIEVRLPPSVAVDVDAATSNARLDLSGLGVAAPDLSGQKGFGRNEVRWRSPGWDQAGTRLRLTLQTSNGGVRVL